MFGRERHTLCHYDRRLCSDSVLVGIGNSPYPPRGLLFRKRARKNVPQPAPGANHYASIHSLDQCLEKMFYVPGFVLGLTETVKVSHSLYDVCSVTEN